MKTQTTQLIDREQVIDALYLAMGKIQKVNKTTSDSKEEITQAFIQALDDIQTISENDMVSRFRSAAGGWSDLLDCEAFIEDIYKSRKINSRPEVKL